MINKPIGDRRSLALSRKSKGSLNPKGSPGRSSQGAVKLRAPALTSPLPANPKAAPGRRGAQDDRSGGHASRDALQGVQEVVPKEPAGHVRDTHLFTLSRPGRAAVPRKLGLGPPGPRSPRTRRSPACDGGRGARRPPQAPTARGGRGVSAPALAGTRGRGTAAGRELSPAGAAAPPPGCCSAARRRPLPGPRAGPSRGAASPPAEGAASAPCVLRPGPAPLPRAQPPASGFSRRASVVGYSSACESLAACCLPFLTPNGARNSPLRDV